MRPLVVIPVYNEADRIAEVLGRTFLHRVDLLAVDDGSTDQTPDILAGFRGVHVVRHRTNRGYGASLRHGFAWALRRGYDAVVTLDADGQHEPALIPEFVDAIGQADIVSGSRYLRAFEEDTDAPRDRRRINMLVTDELNASLDLGLTDSFCGFKAYRARALEAMTLTEDGYGMPLELWIEAACARLRIHEIAVPRVYLDPNRSFGATLDDANARLAYYQRVIDRTLARIRARSGCGAAATGGPMLRPMRTA